MNEKQRKKAVKELREKIIPKIKARNLANNPDKNLKGQGVYRAQAIFTNFDHDTRKALGEKIDKLIRARRKEIKEGQIDRTPHTEALANDIVNYINLKTEEMETYPPIKQNGKGKPYRKSFIYYLKDHPIWAAVIILVMLLASILAIINFVFPREKHTENPARHVNEEFIPELNKILPEDKNKEIFFGIVGGDKEANNFALEIKRYLKSEGWNVGEVDIVGNPRCGTSAWSYGYKDWGDRFEIYVCSK